MKKLIGMLTVLVLMAIFSGCPALVSVTEEVLPDVQIPAGMGKVVVEGDFLSGEKGAIDLNEVVELLKPRISRVELNFYPSNAIGKGGGEFGAGTWGQVFNIDVINGVYSGSFLIEGGDYEIYVVAYDSCGNQLFQDNLSTRVIVGEITRLEVLFGLVFYQTFQFTVNDLPGDYYDFGQARVLSNGESFYISYYRWWFENGESRIVFVALLPVGFTGYHDQSAVVITDLNGEEQSSVIEFDIFDTVPCQPIEVPYFFPNWLTDVVVDFDFEVY